MAYRNSPTLFQTVIPDPVRPPLPQDWGFATQPKTAIAIRLSQERVKLRTANLADTFKGSIRTKAH